MLPSERKSETEDELFVEGREAVLTSAQVKRREKPWIEGREFERNPVAVKARKEPMRVSGGLGHNWAISSQALGGAFGVGVYETFTRRGPCPR